MVDDPRFAVEIALISVVLWEIYVLPVLKATLLIPVIRQCRIYLWALCLILAWSITLFTVLEVQQYLLQIYPAVIESVTMTTVCVLDDDQ